MRTRTQKKASSRANALRRGEENARRRGETPAAKAPRAKEDIEPVRDGLLWLIKKGKLSAMRREAAAIYRAAYREPQEGAMRSCLNLDPRAAGIGVPPDPNAARIDAERQLAAMRNTALSGHEAMIAVMDGVCGGGLTLREMAGGEERAAGRLEAVLMVALDLVGAWRTMRRAA